MKPPFNFGIQANQTAAKLDCNPGWNGTGRRGVRGPFWFCGDVSPITS